MDCADAFLARLGGAVSAIPHSWLAAVEEGEETIRRNGRMTATASRVLAGFEEERRGLLPLMSRVELLFGPEAGAPAKAAVRTVVNASEVLTGAAWISDGVVRYGAEGLGINIETSVADPDEFDPDDDASVALWTRELLESVEKHEREVLQACSAQIRSRHPSQGGGGHP